MLFLRRIKMQIQEWLINILRNVFYSKSVFECISVILKKALDLSVFFISLFLAKVIGLQKRPFSNWSDNCLNQLKIASHLFEDYNTFRARTHKKKLYHDILR